MAQIPIGNFGNALPEPPGRIPIPQGAFDQGGAALAALGDTGMAVVDKMQEDQQGLNRAKAANALSQYDLAVKQIGVDMAPLLADGTISSADADAEHAKRLAAIPVPDVSYADPVTTEHFQGGIKQIQTESSIAMQPMIQNAMVTEQKATLTNAMDTMGKAAGMPGADAAKEIAQVDKWDGEGQKAYGKNWQKVKQDWKDNAWLTVGQANIERNSHSITALQDIQKSLKDPNGLYAGNLDTNQRTALLYKVEEQIHGTIIDANNARILAERETKLQQDQIMQDQLTKAYHGKLRSNEVLNNPTLDFQQKHEMLNILKALSEAGPETNKAVFNSLFMRIHAPDGSPSAITSPDQLYKYVGRGISPRDAMGLRSELDGKSQPEGELVKNFKTMAHDQISASTLFGKDAQGEANFYNWNAYVDGVIAEKRRSGVPLYQLVDPKSKEYLGPTISGYMRDFNQQTADYVARFRSAGPPAAGGKPAQRAPFNPANIPVPVPQRNAAPAGWTLKQDAKGNKAYVSPDGKQFQEVR